MNELALFAGAGGGILGGKLLGWRTVCAVEYDAYAASVLVARQNDGCLEPFPVWSDVRTFDGRPWRGIVDVVSGGFPCQDISAAGKGGGIKGERSKLWQEMARIISEVRPKFVFVENSPLLTSRGLGRVLGDLAALGYDAQWGVLGAIHAGAPHKRERIWIVANTFGTRWHSSGFYGTNQKREILESSRLVSCQNGWNGWNSSPEEKARVLGVADGMAGELDGIKCAGNGQVPAVAALAWRLLGGPSDD
jgi:DNA (cytosine-5)-methyltransferase 1